METEGGYADVARVLRKDRRQVYAWHRRATRNVNGEPFPRPVREERDPARTLPRYIFSIPEVREWYAAGMPPKNPNQYTWTGNGSMP